MSFRVNRLDAFFTIAVFMLLGPQLGRARASQTEAEATPDPVWFRPALTVAAVLIAVVLRWQGVSAIDLSRSNWLPEPEAIGWLKGHDAHGRMVTYFDWAEYAIWHLSPAIKVSMDGRRETVYTDKLIQGHLAIYRDLPNSAAYVRQLNPDYVWLPKQLAAVRDLRATGEWVVGYEGPRSMVLTRRSFAAAGVTSTPAVREPRVFPGP
jgi:hypothetical protein